MKRIFVVKQGFVNILSLAQKVALPKKKLKAYRKKLKSISKSHTGKFVDSKAYNKYQKYIKSSIVWKEKRLQALEYYQNQCCLCGSRFNLQVHHRHYKTLFKESMGDLLVLCKYCHSNHHRIAKQ